MNSIIILSISTLLIASVYTVDVPGNFTLPKNSDNLCFIAQFNMTLNVEYLKIDETKGTVSFPLNNKTFSSYSGDCFSIANQHKLEINLLNDLTSITFLFTRNEKNQTTLTHVSISLTIDQENFLNSSKSIAGIHVFTANESFFATSETNSFRCYSKTMIDNFKSSPNLTITSLDLENLRLQSFVDASIPFKDFAAEKVCTADLFRPSNLVPIIVGACLALLVIVVLVAYLVNRRRDRHGYQSV